MSHHKSSSFISLHGDRFDRFSFAAASPRKHDKGSHLPLTRTRARPTFPRSLPVASPPGLNFSAAGQGYPLSSRSLPTDFPRRRPERRTFPRRGKVPFPSGRSLRHSAFSRALSLKISLFFRRLRDIYGGSDRVSVHTDIFSPSPSRARH
ncbi:hypothetical protein PUN28_007906 [Cardiocondyla obscurior]|uniref:Uncharacterized protein n=1 Tax=Cardiocondyla obscurior TaxID=286306 RepID=A0AAW2FWM6_9HYME